MSEPCLAPIPQRYEARSGFLNSAPAVAAGELPPGLAEPLKTLWPQALKPIGNVYFCQNGQLPSEGYILTVAPEGATIDFSQRAGALYALMTLRQLSAGGGPTPCCRIEDWPGLPNRALLADVSRGKVPTLASLLQLADLMAQFKLNQLQLYIEGFSFEYPSFDELKSIQREALSAEELRLLEGYCAQRCIELVPNQNSLGHMYPWLQLPQYRHLAESPDGVNQQNVTLPPTTLDPGSPASLQLVERMMDDLLACFSSKRFNVNLDEPFELGMGKSRERAEKEGVDTVYLDYVEKLHRAVSKRGFRMMLWGDVLSRSEQALTRLPEDVIVLEWGYEADHPVRRRAERLHRAGRSFYVCPGTNSWASFTGITDNMLQCIGNAATAAHDFGACGLMVTDWGDFGHLQYPVFSLPGIVYAAAGAWNRRLLPEKALAQALNDFVFADRTGVLGRLCLEAGRYSRLEEFLFPCRTLAFLTLQAGCVDARSMQASFKRSVDGMRFFVEPCVYLPCEEEYRRRKPMDEPALLNFLEQLTDRLNTARPACPNGALALREIENGLRMVRAATRLRAYCFGLEGGEGLIREIQELSAEHRQLWLARNRPGGLCESLAAFSAVQRALEHGLPHKNF